MGAGTDIKGRPVRWTGARPLTQDRPPHRLSFRPIGGKRKPGKDRVGSKTTKHGFHLTANKAVDRKRAVYMAPGGQVPYLVILTRRRPWTVRTENRRRNRAAGRARRANR